MSEDILTSNHNFTPLGLAFAGGVLTTYIYVKVGLLDMIVVGGVLLLAYNAQNVADLYSKFKERQQTETEGDNGVYNRLVENIYTFKSNYIG